MKKVLNIILTFFLMALLAWTGFQFVRAAVNAYSNLNVSLQTAIASAVSLIIVAAIGFFTNKAIEQKKIYRAVYSSPKT